MSLDQHGTTASTLNGPVDKLASFALMRFVGAALPLRPSSFAVVRMVCCGSCSHTHIRPRLVHHPLCEDAVNLFVARAVLFFRELVNSTANCYACTLSTACLSRTSATPNSSSGG